MTGLVGEFVRDLLDGEQQNGNLGHAAGDLARSLKAVHLRHGEIEYDDVRAQLLGFSDRIFSVQRVAAYNPVGVILNQAAQEPSDRGIVIGN
jgi:hypothetical protein